MAYDADLGPSLSVPAGERYEAMQYRRCGRSGLRLPAISLGLWQNFGDDFPLQNSRAILRRAFDLGITHFDLANNYGPPYGSAEKNFGRIFAEDFRPYRDELVISTKAGWDMWPGPYGEFGPRNYLPRGLDQSLSRMGLDYVDIFYSHRFDPDTPLRETMGALDYAVRSGKARYIGISSYAPKRTKEAVGALRELLERDGIGAIVFSPLAQGLLTDKYLGGIEDDSRVRRGNYFSEELVSEQNLERARALNEIAQRRGQTLAQLAISWALRDERVTSALLGASSVQQLEQNVAALTQLEFDAEELTEIDRYAQDGGVDLWRETSSS